MGRFVKGDILVVPFPFSDLSGTKRRPVFVAASLKGDDLSLCQITSKNKNDSYAIPLIDSDFEDGCLKVDSMIRPNRIFTAENSIVLYKAGKVNPDKITEVEKALVGIFKEK